MAASVVSLDAFRRARHGSRSSTEGAGGFPSFDAVCAFVLPDPVWVSEDMQECRYTAEDEGLVRDFFAWFGFAVDPNKWPEAQGDGWELLINELASAAAWKRSSPATYRALCGDWPAEQKDYLTALMAADHVKVQELVDQTDIARQLRAKMRTPGGSALK